MTSDAERRDAETVQSGLGKVQISYIILYNEEFVEIKTEKRSQTTLN